MSEVDVRLASLSEVRALQQAVLRPNGPVLGDRPPPDDAVHIGAFAEGVPVGAATILPAPLPSSWPADPADLPGPTWQLRSMAVAAGHRGTGVGALVLALAEGTAAGRGAATLWASARVPALSFYARAGWTVVGDEWDKPGVGPHRWVYLALTSDERLRA